jgi:hypothetical protein
MLRSTRRIVCATDASGDQRLLDPVSVLGVHTVTMELGQDFSLDYSFHWELPISATTQESIASYGSDEDRIRLAGHFSVSVAALEAMAALPSPEVQLAVASNPATPVEALALMASDHDRGVRSAANEAIEHLAAPQRVAARELTQSRMKRLRSRFGA